MILLNEPNGEAINEDDQITLTVKEFVDTVNQAVASSQEHLSEIYARAENVANADEAMLPFALEALRECFEEMNRKALEDSAKDMH